MTRGFSFFLLAFVVHGARADSTASRLAWAPPSAPAIALAGQSNAGFLAPRLQSAYPGRIVCVSRGGASIIEWAPRGALWTALHAQLSPDVAAFVWWQGESDASRDAYRSDLIGLVTRVRAELGRSSLPVIVVRTVNDPALARVRKAQAAYVNKDRAAVLINVDDLKREAPNSYHLTAEGYKVVALRVLQALSSLQVKVRLDLPQSNATSIQIAEP